MFTNGETQRFSRRSPVIIRRMGPFLRPIGLWFFALFSYTTKVQDLTLLQIARPYGPVRLAGYEIEKQTVQTSMTFPVTTFESLSDLSQA